MADNVIEAQETMDPNTLVPKTHVPNAMDLLTIALQNNAAIDVIERLAALQEKSLLRVAEMQFNEAMNAAQAELGRVKADLQNPHTKSWYASYARLDKVLRPIYVRHGFSLSFDSGESPIPGTVLVKCYVSHRGGHSRTYTSPPIPADGKGAKGGDVMTPTHATGAAMAYGSRYLLKFIWNIAVGEDDDDGNLGTNGELAERIEWIENAKDKEELVKIFKDAYAQFETNPAALKVLVQAKNKRKEAMNA